MQVNKINSSVVIFNIYDQYNIKTEDFVTRAPLWIKQCLDIIGSRKLLIPALPKGSFDNYRYLLPLEIEVIDWVVINNRIANYSESLYPFQTNTDNDITFCGKGGTGNDIVSTEDDTTRISQYYKVINGWLHTNVASGKIEIKCQGLPFELDEKLGIKFPIIPNDEDVLNTIEAFILKTLLMRGYIHPVLSFKSRSIYSNPVLMFDANLPKARIALSRMSVNERSKLVNPLASLFGIRKQLYIEDETEIIDHKYSVTIVSGTGGGNYDEGATVIISADDLVGFRFKQWTGDTDVLDSTTVADTNFIMPPKAIFLYAKYDKLYSLTLKIIEEDPGITDWALPGVGTDVLVPSIHEELIFDRWGGDTDVLEYSITTRLNHLVRPERNICLWGIYVIAPHEEAMVVNDTIEFTDNITCVNEVQGIIDSDIVLAPNVHITHSQNASINEDIIMTPNCEIIPARFMIVNDNLLLTANITGRNKVYNTVDDNLSLTTNVTGVAVQTYEDILDIQVHSSYGDTTRLFMFNCIDGNFAVDYYDSNPPVPVSGTVTIYFNEDNDDKHYKILGSNNAKIDVVSFNYFFNSPFDLTHNAFKYLRYLTLRYANVEQVNMPTSLISTDCKGVHIVDTSINQPVSLAFISNTTSTYNVRILDSNVNFTLPSDIPNGTLEKFIVNNDNTVTSVTMPRLHNVSSTCEIELSNCDSLANVSFSETSMMAGTVVRLSFSYTHCGYVNLQYVPILSADSAEVDLSNMSLVVSDINHYLTDFNSWTTGDHTDRVVVITGNASPDSSSGGYDGIGAMNSLISKGISVVT